MQMYNTYVPNRFVEENEFLKMPRQDEPLPLFEDVKDLLPEPLWVGHQDALDCYWKVWQIAFRNLRQPTEKSGFVANFIDTAFNDCLFLWDSAFIVLFARYGSRAFDFQRTLDNFYARQHPDGYICREIAEGNGEERFGRFDPSSTGPNVLPWPEWEYFLQTNDRDRLRRVFPALVAYYQWFRTYRSWPDGTYWLSGWGCGMDNVPRLDDPSFEPHFSHGHLSWVDTCLQQIFAGKLLLQMADVLDRRQDIKDIESEIIRLAEVVNRRMWDDATSFYYDYRADIGLSGVKHIGAYWALLAGIVPTNDKPAFIAHLEDPAEFNRPHRVPTLSADHPQYCDTGGYWRGAVWAPTNYMVMRGLTLNGEDALAHEIARNHHHNVVETFVETATVWENYAPEETAAGRPAKADFVGWTGLPPVAVLFEYIFGLRPDVPNGKLLWDVRLLDEHGVARYPLGNDGLLKLRCLARSDHNEEPAIEADSNVPVELEVKWAGGNKTIKLPGK